MNNTNDEKIYCVYKHTSPSGKVYIGITKTKPEKRWGKDGSGYKTQQYFWRAIQKYGWNNFKHEILYVGLTQEEAEKIEINLIAYYKSNQREYGYNIESGGNSTGKMSDETRKKLSEAMKGRESPNKGKTFGKEFREKISKAKKGILTGPRSEETKRKISEGNKGKIMSEESRNKLSDIQKNKWQDEEYRQNQIEKHKWQAGEKHPWFGRHHTEETKEKISNSHKGMPVSESTRKKLSDMNSGVNNPFYGRKHSEETRKKISEKKQGSNNAYAKMILQLDKQDNCIRIWGYIRQASDELEINYNSICLCCKGVQKTAGGYKWLYVYDQRKKDDTIIQGAISLGYITEETVKEQL